MLSQMDLEGIMLSEISQRKTNTVWSDLYVESKQQRNKNQKQKPEKNLTDTENRLVIAEGRAGGQMGKGSQKAQKLSVLNK